MPGGTRSSSSKNNFGACSGAKPLQVRKVRVVTRMCCTGSQRGDVGPSFRSLIFFCLPTLHYRQGVSLSRGSDTGRRVPSCPLSTWRRNLPVKCSEKAPESAQNATGARISRAASATERRVRSSEAIPATPKATPRLGRRPRQQWAPLHCSQQGVCHSPAPATRPDVHWVLWHRTARFRAQALT